MYAGDGSDEAQVVAKLGGWHLSPDTMAQDLYCLADAD
jgi:hypothetical protein